MNLANESPVAFIAIHNAAAARVFYENTLGLRFESDDPLALVFRVGSAPGIMLRFVKMPEVSPVPFTVFGWEVSGIEAAVDGLTANGVSFLGYDTLPQDDRGVWTSPGGSRIAWFQAPDGNTLSISQHPPRPGDVN
jgi:catechol 2,3-dioxygenase-like lactoylglutathione lyase family enzyme